jgi:hypothetical protein
MNERDLMSSLCVCGRRLEWQKTASSAEQRDLACACGRVYELEVKEAGWDLRLNPLTPEARQPLAGFSREIRLREDCLRYYFIHSIGPGHQLPVHLLYSPSAREAEVKFGDAKAFKVTAVDSPGQARRRWIEWFDSRPGRTEHFRHVHRPRVVPTEASS